MKLVQLNAWGGRLTKSITDLINTEKPDLICLQEILSFEGTGLFFLTLEELQAETKLPNAFFSPVFTFKFMHKNAGFGNAVVSKSPFEKEETIFTRLVHQEDFDFDKHDYNIRNLQHVVVPINGKKLHILNHHGHHVPTHKDGDGETLRQCRQIVDYIKGLEGPIILTGDFNLSPGSKSLQQVNRALRNLAIEAKLTTTRTPLTHKTEVCDYIFVNDRVRVENFIASDEIVSDHKALILEFEL